jgi:sterol desaturase/sphingolipid hydroxylase (fatty acid hydroxylase superfamily)
MTLDPIALAVPFFFLLIGLELLVARARRQRVYRFTDSFADLGCGVAQRVVLLLFEASLLAVYALLYEHGRLVTFAPGSPWPCVIAIVGVDLGYYWWHRLSHEVNFLWAVHAVHHQSEDYNLAVALRQAVLSPITVMPFYLPLAVLGVPVLVYFIVVALSTLYQFWIHTELVGRMGVLEHLVNTPSLHRVHHGVNPEYLDKNYAATFICWDQLFGPFAARKPRSSSASATRCGASTRCGRRCSRSGLCGSRCGARRPAREAIRFFFASPDGTRTGSARCSRAGAWTPKRCRSSTCVRGAVASGTSSPSSR